MEEIKVRYHSFQKALLTLENALIKLDNPNFKEVYDELRDSVIQRFEYSIDTLWKLLKVYLSYKYNIEVAIVTPKNVTRECLTVKLINDSEFGIVMEMIEARNLTSHTYNEILAQDIVLRIRNYSKTMQVIINRIIV